MPTSPRPGPHPFPPSPEEFAQRQLPVRSVRGPLHRVHRAELDPLFFGRSGLNRFDDPLGDFGVLYAGLSAACAFIETFGDLEFPAIERSLLDARRLSVLELRRPLRLVQLRSHHLRRLGADARLCVGEHSIAQAWSRAIHDHPTVPDGLAFVCRRDPSQVSVALFERAGAALVPRVATDVLGSSANRDVLEMLLSRYELGLSDGD